MDSRMELRRYLTRSGRDVFGEWLSGLKDYRTKAKIVARIDRLSLGNFGDCKSLGNGLFELRINWGPGYRVYYAAVGGTCVLLLCGGDKRKQSADIKRALEYIKDYRERTL
jgi:putative addiction module killer protein